MPIRCFIRTSVISNVSPLLLIVSSRFISRLAHKAAHPLPPDGESGLDKLVFGFAEPYGYKTIGGRAVVSGPFRLYNQSDS